MILKLVGEIRRAFSPFDWSKFLMTYLLAIAAATLLRAVAIAAAIARATVVRLRLVARAIADIAKANSAMDSCSSSNEYLQYMVWSKSKKNNVHVLCKLHFYTFTI